MNGDALKTVQWIHTTSGPCTPYEFLLHCHETEYALDLDRPGFEVGAQFRFLLSMVALAVREEIPESARPGGRITRDQAERLVETGFTESAVAAAYEKVAPYANLRDAERPFMQRPRLEPTSPKDSSRRLGRNDHPVKKLSPAMPSDEGEDYWNLLVSFPEVLTEAAATLLLVVNHYYSLAGNNNYDGDKAQMGAPGIRFLGKGNAATEFWWQEDEQIPLASMLTSIPQNWIPGEILPAWAERDPKKAREGLEFAPLWAATWSSNTAVGFWEGEELTGVRVGGIPTSWWPVNASDKSGKALLKQWWDTRNEADPLYLYVANDKNELKAQRIDFGRDGTDLAVEWTAEEKMRALTESTEQNLLPTSGADRRPIFLRHQLEGTASSPSIRASEVFFPDDTVWAFDVPEEAIFAVVDAAQIIREVHSIFRGRFRRHSSQDSKREQSSGRLTPILDALADAQPDASAEFWREVTATYEDFLDSARQGQPDVETLLHGLHRSALLAYDRVTHPYLDQHSAEIYYTRSALSRIIRAKLREKYPVFDEELKG
ncbi:type I-E CRISPR-associated protein Cse1/CasA [Actinobaculum suis]|uniref:type I-E CRISPR-associated protein Cse1/CasA n=1 Tax=Actinobaculum suis TaxID=1657 RepID=UPI0009F412D8|nr:type I-E CRISPR-associated protein Cse1/CasA [Actinobaculum suis]